MDTLPNVIVGHFATGLGPNRAGDAFPLPLPIQTISIDLRAFDLTVDPWDWTNVPESLEGHAGFVYRITCLSNGKKYIGKKLFTASRKRKLAKRKDGKAIVGSKKKVVRDRVDSKWKDYFGSSKELLADLVKFGKENFRREILQLAPSKGVLSYYELQWQMKEDALFRSDYYNGVLNIRLGRNIFPKYMLEAADIKYGISATPAPDKIAA